MQRHRKLSFIEFGAIIANLGLVASVALFMVTV